MNGTADRNPAVDVSDHLLTCGPCNGQPGQCTRTAEERGEPAREQLTGNVWLGRQSVNFEGLWDIAGESVRVTITRDCYDFQSRAVAEMFDPTARKWNVVASLPPARMASLHLSYNRKPDADEDEAEVTFYADAHDLLDVVALLVKA